MVKSIVAWAPAVVAGALAAAAEDGGGTFGRFDRNRDGFVDGSEAPSVLSRRMDQFDKNGDGKLDPGEFVPVAERMSRTGDGRKGGGAGPMPRRQDEVNAPPAPGERYPDKLKLGDRAPDFTLPLADGTREITLSKYHAGKPVVLVFGSLTCPPFRARMLQFDPIYQKHKERVKFLMVYTREAHPESTIYVNKGGEKVLQKIEQTDRMDERMEHARICGPTLKFTFPTVVDKVDNQVNEAYAGWPSRFVVVDRDGRLAFDGGPGPSGFQPAELDRWLAANLR
jgi:thiol-disulfide isomerase/thioredoxin